jgi:hypothetical protein
MTLVRRQSPFSELVASCRPMGRYSNGAVLRPRAARTGGA